MSTQTKTQAIAGAAAVVTGVMLIGTTGLTFVVGWAMWAVGLVALLLAIPSAGEKRDDGHRRGASARYSLVR